MAKNKLKNKTPKYEYGEFFFDVEKYTYSMFFKQYIWVHIVLISLLAISIFFTLAIKLNHLHFLEVLQNNNQLKKEIKEKGIPKEEKLNGYPIFSFFRNHYAQEDWFERMLADFQKSYGERYDL